MPNKFKILKAKHLKLGEKGENIACRLLKRKNYDILFRNFKTPKGEIDIIARDGSILCFIEVKTRRNRKPVASGLRPAILKLIKNHGASSFRRRSLAMPGHSRASSYAKATKDRPGIETKPWVSYRQSQRIIRAAKDYLFEIDNPKIRYRFDLIEITVTPYSIKNISHWLYNFGYQ